MTHDPTKLADELERLAKHAYPAPWCWEQCGEKSDDPVIGAAWWEYDDSFTPIAGKVEPPADNIDRPLQREAIALEMPSHADGSASANAALIVELRNNLPAILAALRRPTPPPDVAKGPTTEQVEAFEKRRGFTLTVGENFAFDAGWKEAIRALASQGDPRRETEFSKAWDEAWASQDAPSAPPSDWEEQVARACDAMNSLGIDASFNFRDAETVLLAALQVKP